MSTLEEGPVCIHIRSRGEYLPVVRAALERMCDQVGFVSDTTGQIVLSLDEALTNIIRHAYEGAEDEPIEIEFVPKDTAGRTGLEILVRDYGKVVDPSTIKGRDLDDIRPGGLGVHIMRECMDKVEYTRAKGGGTLLRMFKKLKLSRENTSR